VGKSLSYQARREVLQQVAPQYREASSSQKRTLHDAFVATTGYHRTYARWLLNHAEEVQQTHGRSQLRKYGPDVQHALFLAWHAANRICAKRLIPFLPTLIEALERHEHLQISEECAIPAACHERSNSRSPVGLSAQTESAWPLHHAGGNTTQATDSDPHLPRVEGGPTRFSGSRPGGSLWRR